MLLLFIFSFFFFIIIIIILFFFVIVIAPSLNSTRWGNRARVNRLNKKKRRRCKQNREAEKYVNCDYCVCLRVCAVYYVLCLNISSIYCVQLQSAGPKRERRRKKSTENWLQYIYKYTTCTLRIVHIVRGISHFIWGYRWEFSFNNKWFTSQTFTITPFQ